MRGASTLFPAAWLISSSASATQICQTPSNKSVDLSWHRPKASPVNDLSHLFNRTGVYGYVFNSSDVPEGVAYGTYNYCNMPHVRSSEYVKAPGNLRLKYVDVIHRHHKRTPYASNAFPEEQYSWNCDDEALFYYGKQEPDGSAAQIRWQVYTSASNPLKSDGFRNSTCQFPQISSGGLQDSLQHGKDLFKLYHDELEFLPDKLDNTVSYRVTNNQITSQVASQVISAMYPDQARQQDIAVLIQSDSIDSLEPTYSCPYASSLRLNYSIGSSHPAWRAHLDASSNIFQTLDSISGVNPTDPDWHNWFDHYFDNLSSKLCHSQPLSTPLSDSSAITDQVLRLGLYEYSFIYRDSPFSLLYSTPRYGIFLGELAQNLRDAIGGKSEVRYRHNFAHDGSISLLLSILQVDTMVWPGMGSEVVFELYEDTKPTADTCEQNSGGDGPGGNSSCVCRSNWLRILWGGQVLESSSPTLRGREGDGMIDVDLFLGYVDGLVGKDAEKVPGLCAQRLS